MIKYRLAKTTDVDELKNIWKLTFGDPAKFIDFYFSSRFNPKNTYLLLKDEAIASMLTVIPVRLITSQNSFPGAMFYAIATHPRHQKQGFATQLTKYVNQEIKKEGNRFSVIVPATRNLFDFYLKQGYKEFFTVNEQIFTIETINKFLKPPATKINLKPLDPAGYNQKRRQLISNEVYLDYDEEEIIYQHKLSRFSGADLYLVEISKDHDSKRYGIMAVERIDLKRVIIKEALVADEFLMAALKGLSLILPACEYLLRTPSFFRINSKTTIKPFGLIKTFAEEIIIEESSGYLGLAFD